MIKFIATEENITAVIDGKIMVCDRDNPNFDVIKKALQEGQEEKLKSLFNHKIIQDAKAALNSLGKGAFIKDE